MRIRHLISVNKRNTKERGCPLILGFNSYPFNWNYEKVTNNGRRGSDRIVVGFTPTCAISAYHH